MGRFDHMTDEEFRDILEDIVTEEGANILSIPGVYESASEHFNNEVLRRWEDKMYGTAVGCMPGSDVFHAISGDYDLDDEDQDGLMFLFTDCGKELNLELHYKKKVTCKACLRTRGSDEP
ncbi:MAG: hypothetical protein ACWGQW_05305 [bacterium]